MLASAPWQSLICPQNITLACNSCASQAGKGDLARILNASLKSKLLLLPFEEMMLSILMGARVGGKIVCALHIIVRGPNPLWNQHLFQWGPTSSSNCIRELDYAMC